MLLHRHRLTVRFRDCDPLGHVNNAVYFTYLEQARFSLWRAQVDFQARREQHIAPRGTGPILARAECDFKSQARSGDELEVQISLDAIGRTSFTYSYQIVDAPTDRLIAQARTVQVWFDYDKQRPVPIPDELKAKLSAPV